ncbi:hypothetical protein [Clostridium tagluense]|uniref:Uncharacterized protein n=1 Tax=Clostridium tagluense TaxID=360422 RepID=A0A401UKG0_9CLOT|nr:hypothetical protein [Clostridium tagluense]GCD10037.1 hypothetical protein Ctaglu_16600 [Clostridium tagluense]
MINKYTIDFIEEKKKVEVQVTKFGGQMEVVITIRCYYPSI